MPPYPAAWNPYMYGYQAPSSWFPQGFQQVPPHVAMGQPGSSGQQVYPPAENIEVDEVEPQLSPEHTRKRKSTKKCVTRIKLGNFNPDEDTYLVKSWLEISADPVTSTGQKSSRMWERILDRYNLKRGSNPERSVRSLQSRWDNIKGEVGKFAAFHADATRENPSGMSDSDKTTIAAANFAAVYKHNFPYMHCWNIMKYEPKWQDPKPRSVPKSSAWPLAWRRARCRDWSVSKPRPPPNTPSSSVLHEQQPKKQNVINFVLFVTNRQESNPLLATYRQESNPLLTTYLAASRGGKGPWARPRLRKGSGALLRPNPPCRGRAREEGGGGRGGEGSSGAAAFRRGEPGAERTFASPRAVRTSAAALCGSSPALPPRPTVPRAPHAGVRLLAPAPSSAAGPRPLSTARLCCPRTESSRRGGHAAGRGPVPRVPAELGERMGWREVSSGSAELECRRGRGHQRGREWRRGAAAVGARASVATRARPSLRERKEERDRRGGIKK